MDIHRHDDHWSRIRRRVNQSTLNPTELFSIATYSISRNSQEIPAVTRVPTFPRQRDHFYAICCLFGRYYSSKFSWHLGRTTRNLSLRFAVRLICRFPRVSLEQGRDVAYPGAIIKFRSRVFVDYSDSRYATVIVPFLMANRQTESFVFSILPFFLVSVDFCATYSFRVYRHGLRITVE